MFALGKNIGYDFVGVVGSNKSQPDFAGKQQEAWDMARQAIDEGLPCYGWEFEFPEYYVVNGYDDIGYYYNGPDAEPVKGPKPWQELGKSSIGLLELFCINRGQPADDATDVREALEFALMHATGTDECILPNYNSGLAGYDTWIETVAQDGATPFGMSYNAAVWAECRAMGLKFFEEARQRLDGDLKPCLDEAIGSYSPVVENLNTLVALFPLINDMSIIDGDRRDKSLTYLKKAREAEEKGLKSLENIVAALGS